VCYTNLLVDGLLISGVHTLDGGSQLLDVGNSLENTCNVPQPSDIFLSLALSRSRALARALSLPYTHTLTFATVLRIIHYADAHATAQSAGIFKMARARTGGSGRASRIQPPDAGPMGAGDGRAPLPK
jgi:hypothetical protein